MHVYTYFMYMYYYMKSRYSSKVLDMQLKRMGSFFFSFFFVVAKLREWDQETGKRWDKETGKVTKNSYSLVCLYFSFFPLLPDLFG